MNGRPHTTTDFGLAAVAGFAAFTFLLWLGGESAVVVSGHDMIHGRFLAGVIAFAHVGHPASAWGSPVGPVWIYWLCTVLVVTIAGVLTIFAFTVTRHVATGRPGASPARGEGFAPRAEIERSAGSRALLRRSRTLRPSLRHPRPADVGYFLGKSRQVACWASVEDSMLLLGPPRSGKGQNIVIPAILDAPGAVVTTSTRPDNLAVTLAARTCRGPVAVFDPQGLATDRAGAPTLRWSVVRGCENPQTAMIRAEALVGDAGKSGVENANFWRQQALSATRCMLHAAALDDRSASDLYRWSHSAPGAKEAVSILGSHPAATPGWERALDAIIASDQRTRDSVWAMVANTFAPLADPSVLASVSPDAGHEFDPVAFLAMRGTLFLLGTSTGASATGTLVAAFIEDVIDAARRLASTSPGQRLDPPLALVLDEAANYPLPSLPSLMSEGGGSGITTIAVLQSLSQARDRWGREAAGAIWDSAIVKIVLGGSGNADDLADISRLVGEQQTTEWSHTVQQGQVGRSASSSTRWRPILEPSEIRRLPIGHGLLILRSAQPIMMKLRPWTARPDAKVLVASRHAFEELGTAEPVRDGSA
jgi:type IV secretory pathway TraG/TraD family ATPase VirD4